MAAMGQLQHDFTVALRSRLADAGWRPQGLGQVNNRLYYGTDRQRDWIEPDFWVRLDGIDAQPTVLAELDTSPADLGHNVAKYLWWLGRGHPPIWQPPAILVSAFTERLPMNYRLHEEIARYLGELLAERSPGVTHQVVTLRGGTDDGIALPLADRVFQVVLAWVGTISTGPEA